MPEFIKNNKFKIIFGIFVFILLIYQLFFERPTEEPGGGVPTPAISESQATFNNLAPGISDLEDARQNLGEPVDTNENVVEFRSTAPGKPHKVILENERVVLIQETVTLADDKSISDIQAQFGEPDTVLYGPRINAEFYLHVYPEQGIAYVGQPGSGLLLEVWYFEPTSLSSFRERFAPEYKDEPFYKQ